MSFIYTPEEIPVSEIRDKSVSFSPAMYRHAHIPTQNVKAVRELLDNSHPYDKGCEPGSRWYVQRSTQYFIRTKALQEHSNLLYPKGDAIIPINPRVFEDYHLSDGDILMSKDSNVGECIIVDGGGWKKYMFSGGIVRLHPICNRWYFFSFLKHQLFKTQLQIMAPRGATITHAKSLWLDCLIPFPNQSNAEQVIHYVAAIMQAIVDKEIAIRQRSAEISRLIKYELLIGQKSTKPFLYSCPTSKLIRELGRLDAVIYDHEYAEKKYQILNYKYGTQTPTQMGFVVTPGPSLEIKSILTRIDSDIPKPGFYTLILPTNISEYGTMNAIQYLGTGKKLPLLKKGDVIFGEAGFQKGRSIVLIEPYNNCTTNAHGLYARRTDNDIIKSIFFRCFFNWYREMRLIDIMGVGGSGGHLSPSYFDDFIHIPNFPDNKQEEIARLYHNPILPPNSPINSETFVSWHRHWNVELGIWELDREMKVLQKKLLDVQNAIIEGNPVQVPLN